MSKDDFFSLANQLLRPIRPSALDISRQRERERERARKSTEPAKAAARARMKKWRQKK